MTHKTSKKRGQKKLYGFLILGTFAVLFLSAAFWKANSNRQPQRNQFNFEEITNTPFATYTNHESGFSIQYPTNAEFSTIPQEGIIELPFVEGLSISLISQIQRQTEVYDGLLIKIMMYRNNNNYSLNDIVPTVGPTSQPGIREKEPITVNGISGYKTTYCCYAGGSTSYYFESKDKKYFVEMAFFSAGPEKKEFDQVAEKIIQSIKFD